MTTSPAAAGQTPRFGPSTRVEFHELAIREDGADWIVGRRANRTFVALPAEGIRVIELLRGGGTVGSAAARLRSEAGADFDVPDYLRSLTELGFVATVDGRPVDSPPPAAATLPWLRQRHTAWSLSPVWPGLLALLAVAASVVLVGRPELLPSYRALLWSPFGSLVLLAAFGVGWTLVFLHELGHLVTARASGVPGRITLGTRLQFLVAQTDISGIETAPRRHRLTAYLAGIGVNLAVASAATIGLAMTNPTGAAGKALSLVALMAVLPIPFQFLVFMRTDVYFVLQDLMGCRNLHGDARAYLRYLASRWTLRPGVRDAAAHPLKDLPARERRAVRGYSVVQGLGTLLCLAFFAAVTLPADAHLIVRSLIGLRAHESPVRVIDSIVVIVVLGGVHVLWAVTWWRGRNRTAGKGRKESRPHAPYR
ncbi:hypothetical protein AB0M28_08170 [Streptomyces sp. NPDC051940]|uniref:hypothetical protein n=1 Tax=Streptomyces sp. NPDC051940 TaxID=3155675 RepID=UPI00341435BD